VPFAADGEHLAGELADGLVVVIVERVVAAEIEVVAEYP
jgi:hypothetical protein